MRKRSISILALVIAIAITVYFSVVFWTSTRMDSDFKGSVSQDIFPSYNDTAFGGVFATDEVPLNDSLPHYLYRHLADSIKKVSEDRQLENRSTGLTGMAFGSLGLYTMQGPISKKQGPNKMMQGIKLLDSLDMAASKKIATLTNKDSIQHIKDQLKDTLAALNRRMNQPEIVPQPNAPDNLYYLSLQGYSLNYETKFFVQNGTYNLAVLKLDSTKGPADNLFRYGHYERKQIPVRYSADNKMVLIPLSQKQYKVLNILVPVLGYGLMFVSLYFFIGLPLQILVSISKGNAFNDKNIRRFNSMALVLLILGLGSALFPYIMRLCFSVPDDFRLPGFWSAIWDMIGLFIVALAIFIAGKAFQKGNKLQKEQDLTI